MGIRRLRSALGYKATGGDNSVEFFCCFVCVCVLAREFVLLVVCFTVVLLFVSLLSCCLFHCCLVVCFTVVLLFVSLLSCCLFHCCLVVCFTVVLLFVSLLSCCLFHCCLVVCFTVVLLFVSLLSCCLFHCCLVVAAVVCVLLWVRLVVCGVSTRTRAWKVYRNIFFSHPCAISVAPQMRENIPKAIISVAPQMRENIPKAIMILKLAAKNGGRKSGVFRQLVPIG